MYPCPKMTLFFNNIFSEFWSFLPTFKIIWAQTVSCMSNCGKERLERKEGRQATMLCEIVIIKLCIIKATMLWQQFKYYCVGDIMHDEGHHPLPRTQMWSSSCASQELCYQDVMMVIVTLFVMNCDHVGLTYIRISMNASCLPPITIFLSRSDKWLSS